jgi:serine protease Do
MNKALRLNNNVRSIIKTAFVSLLIIWITIACENSPADHANRAEDMQTGIKNIPSLVASEAGAATVPIEMVPKSFSALAEMASPAVVNIRTVKTAKGGGRVFRHFQREPFDKDDRMREFFERFFGEQPEQNFKQRSLGSGFIIGNEGYVVTNNHVIEDADEIQVILKNEKVYEAKIIGRDASTDIAVIQILSDDDFEAIKLGNSNTLKIGQWVVAIGNPFGLENTVTAGIVSAKGRIIESGPYNDYIQTDASINPGNSGGPLLNMDGEVVGINTMIFAGGRGIGFAIPVNVAKNVVAQLRERGAVTRGWLGVSIQDVPNDIAEYFGIEDKRGALVADVVPGDPAETAGIRPKDIIVEVNGQNVADSRELLRLVAGLNVGQTVDVKVLRNGRINNFQVKVAKRNDAKLTAKKAPVKSVSELGIQIADLSSKEARRFELSDTEGVMLVGVKSGSRGENAGLRAGDVIKGVNRVEVKNIADYKRIIDSIESGETIAFLIKRRNWGYLVVKVEK